MFRILLAAAAVFWIALGFSSPAQSYAPSLSSRATDIEAGCRSAAEDMAWVAGLREKYKSKGEMIAAAMSEGTTQGWADNYREYVISLINAVYKYPDKSPEDIAKAFYKFCLKRAEVEA